jgi:hypothetical protein
MPGLLDLLDDLLDRLRPPRPPQPPKLSKTFVITFVFAHHQQPPKGFDMANPIALAAGQGATVTATITGASGNPARVDGVPEWSADPAGGLAKLEPAADGMSAQITAGAETQAVLVSMTVDADLGEGVRQLIGTLECDITAAEEEASFIQLDATPNEVNPL